MRDSREGDSLAEKSPGRAECEGRFGGCTANGVAVRGAPLKARERPVEHG